MENQEVKDREVQEKLAVLQQLQAEADTVQRRIVELELLSSEYSRTIETLEYFNSIDGSVEALMNLGGGVFAYVDIKNAKKLLVDVGAGVVIERDIESALEFVKKKRDKIEEEINRLTSIVQQIAAQAARVQEELSKMVRKE
jgi:prefoldin alpha subunit